MKSTCALLSVSHVKHNASVGSQDPVCTFTGFAPCRFSLNVAVCQCESLSILLLRIQTVTFIYCSNCNG
uniref:Uncharacterized protein n=1 Tax=Anguilla anguilla TaxID=7936 RepID=A0A0E9WXQ9_ANGAN